MRLEIERKTNPTSRGDRSGQCCVMVLSRSGFGARRTFPNFFFTNFNFDRPELGEAIFQKPQNRPYSQCLVFLKCKVNEFRKRKVKNTVKKEGKKK